MGERLPSHRIQKLDGRFEVTQDLHFVLQMRPLRRDLTLTPGPPYGTVLPFWSVHREG